MPSCLTLEIVDSGRLQSSQSRSAGIGSRSVSVFAATGIAIVIAGVVITGSVIGSDSSRRRECFAARTFSTREVGSISFR
jgi:hypothetical protein